MKIAPAAAISHFEFSRLLWQQEQQKPKCFIRKKKKEFRDAVH